jgi:acetolactate synthase-1/2/3 large subunit
MPTTANLEPQACRGDIDMPAIVACCRSICPADAVLTNGAGNFASWVHRFFRTTAWPRATRRSWRPRGHAWATACLRALRADHDRPAGLHDRRRWRLPDERPGAGHGRAVRRQEHHRAAQQRHVRHDPHAPGARVPARRAGTELRNPDFAALAQAYGYAGVRITRTESSSRSCWPPWRRAEGT